MSYLYLIPVGIAIILGIIHIIRSEIKEKKMIDRPFLNELSNELYILSYSAPFKWFINPNENDKRVKNIEKLIIDANESYRWNYRTYVTIQIIMFSIATIGVGVFSLLADNSVLLFKYLFNINIDATNHTLMLQVKISVAMILILLILVPKIYLSNKAKKNKFFFIKGLPILQLFIILMLKAKRPLNEVLYVLSTTNTDYKHIFDTTYRIYIRDKSEGMDYLKKAFNGTKFEETIQVLTDYSEYSKKDTLIVLENGLKDITEYTNTLKRRKDIGANVFSQLSLAFPFLSACLLIFAPLAYYGINLMNF